MPNKNQRKYLRNTVMALGLTGFLFLAGCSHSASRPESTTQTPTLEEQRQFLESYKVLSNEFNPAQDIPNEKRLWRIRWHRHEHFANPKSLLNLLSQKSSQGQRIQILLDLSTYYPILDELSSLQKKSEDHLQIRFQNFPSQKTRQKMNLLLTEKNENSFWTNIFWSGWLSNSSELMNYALDKKVSKNLTSLTARHLTDLIKILNSKDSSSAETRDWLRDLNATRAPLFFQSVYRKLHFDETQKTETTESKAAITNPNKITIGLDETIYRVDPTSPFIWMRYEDDTYSANFEKEWDDESLSLTLEQVLTWANNDFQKNPKALATAMQNCKHSTDPDELSNCIGQSIWMSGAKNRTQRTSSLNWLNSTDTITTNTEKNNSDLVANLKRKYASERRTLICPSERGNIDESEILHCKDKSLTPLFARDKDLNFLQALQQWELKLLAYHQGQIHQRESLIDLVDEKLKLSPHLKSEFRKKFKDTEKRIERKLPAP